MGEVDRRLAGIVAVDVVGYSVMVGADEPGTLARVRALRTDLIEPLAATHGGRLFKVMGDGFLLAFASAVQALRYAAALQAALRAEENGLRLRIGVHQGEVVPEGDDLLGDGVIIAARLQSLAQPGEIVISARVREDAAGKMPLQVDDLGTPTLKNIAQSVHVFRVRPDAPERAGSALPDKPSLAVQPFTNLSGDPEQEYFADGLAEDITAALSRVSGIVVIARNSAFTYKGRAVDIKQVGRELGVRYVLEGSVRKAGDRVRITCQLIEALTGAHLWADRFDGVLEDIFAVQDRVTANVAGAMEPTLRRAEIERAARKPTESLEAYDLYLRSLPHFNSLEPEGVEQATRLLREATLLDPTFGLALAQLAWCLWVPFLYGWARPCSVPVAEIMRLVRSAVVRAGTDPVVMRVAGLLSDGRCRSAGWHCADRALACAECQLGRRAFGAGSSVCLRWRRAGRRGIGRAIGAAQPARARMAPGLLRRRGAFRRRSLRGGGRPCATRSARQSEQHDELAAARREPRAARPRCGGGDSRSATPLLHARSDRCRYPGAV
jgi:adenylate cyclase